MDSTYTLCLELADDPVELLQALDAIAADGGNVRSVSYDRDDVTPCGKVTVDLVLEVEPTGLESIVDTWQGRGIEVVRTERERDTNSVTVLLDGAPIGADLARTLSVVTEESHISVSELSWTAGDDASNRSCTRVRVVAEPTVDGDPLQVVRQLAAEHGYRIIE